MLFHHIRMREILTKPALFHPKTTSATRFFAFIHAACTAAFAHTQRFIDLMLQVVRLSTKMFTLSPPLLNIRQLLAQSIIMLSKRRSSTNVLIKTSVRISYCVHQLLCANPPTAPCYLNHGHFVSCFIRAIAGGHSLIDVASVRCAT